MHVHGDEIRGRFALKNKSRHPPFEISQGPLLILMAACFREDMDPGMMIGYKLRWRHEGILAVCREGKRVFLVDNR
jgi:hypothetical protein